MMTAKSKKSAKDIAFDKERFRFQKKIRELESEREAQKKQIEQLQFELHDKEVLLAEKEDWIRRLLEYLDLPEEEMRKLIDSQKTFSAAVIARSFFLLQGAGRLLRSHGAQM